jgi:thiol:disulfide interchange protein DsbC
MEKVINSGRPWPSPLWGRLRRPRFALLQNGIRIVGAALATLLMVSAANAEEAKGASNGGDVWRSALPNTRINEVRPEQRFPGMFEIVMSDKVVYGDASGRYLIFGHIYDVQTQQDITQQRIDEVSASRRIPWDNLPLKHALREDLAPPEAPQLAVLFSLQCPWCRKLYDDIKSEKDKDGTITRKGLEFQADVRIMLLAPDRPKPTPGYLKTSEKFVYDVADRIVCGTVPESNLERAMADGFAERFSADMAASKSPPDRMWRTRGCKSEPALEAVRKFASEHGLTSTPVLISGDGRVHRGYLPPDQLLAWLREGRAASPATEKQEVTGQ